MFDIFYIKIYDKYVLFLVLFFWWRKRRRRDREREGGEREKGERLGEGESCKNKYFLFLNVFVIVCLWVKWWGEFMILIYFV